MRFTILVLSAFGLMLDRHALTAATVFFVGVKLATILLPLSALGEPRIGDDALYYLWKAKQFAVAYATDAPALTDVLMQHSLDDSPSEATKLWRSRIHTKTIGTQSPLYDAVNGVILASKLRR
jgi:hypothetical protein